MSLISDAFILDKLQKVFKHEKFRSKEQKAAVRYLPIIFIMPTVILAKAYPGADLGKVQGRGVINGLAIKRVNFFSVQNSF